MKTCLGGPEASIYVWEALWSERASGRRTFGLLDVALLHEEGPHGADEEGIRIAKWLFTSNDGRVFKKSAQTSTPAHLRDRLLRLAAHRGRKDGGPFAMAVDLQGRAVPVDENAWKCMLAGTIQAKFITASLGSAAAGLRIASAEYRQVSKGRAITLKRVVRAPPGIKSEDGLVLVPWRGRDPGIESALRRTVQILEAARGVTVNHLRATFGIEGDNMNVLLDRATSVSFTPLVSRHQLNVEPDPAQLCPQGSTEPLPTRIRRGSLKCTGDFCQIHSPNDADATVPELAVTAGIIQRVRDEADRGEAHALWGVELWSWWRIHVSKRPRRVAGYCSEYDPVLVCKACYDIYRTLDRRRKGSDSIDEEIAPGQEAAPLPSATLAPVTGHDAVLQDIDVSLLEMDRRMQKLTEEGRLPKGELTRQSASLLRRSSSISAPSQAALTERLSRPKVLPEEEGQRAKSQGDSVSLLASPMDRLALPPAYRAPVWRSLAEGDYSKDADARESAFLRRFRSPSMERSRAPMSHDNNMAVAPQLRNNLRKGLAPRIIQKDVSLSLTKGPDAYFQGSSISLTAADGKSMRMSPVAHAKARGQSHVDKVRKRGRTHARSSPDRFLHPWQRKLEQRKREELEAAGLGPRAMKQDDSRSESVKTLRQPSQTKHVGAGTNRRVVGSTKMAVGWSEAPALGRLRDSLGWARKTVEVCARRLYELHERNPSRGLSANVEAALVSARALVDWFAGQVEDLSRLPADSTSSYDRLCAHFEEQLEVYLEQLTELPWKPKSNEDSGFHTLSSASSTAEAFPAAASEDDASAKDKRMKDRRNEARSELDAVLRASADVVGATCDAGSVSASNTCPSCLILPVARRCLDCTQVGKDDAGMPCKDLCSACYVRSHRRPSRQGHRFMRILELATTTWAPPGRDMPHSLMCVSCGSLPATRHCHECDSDMCPACHVRIHRSSTHCGHTFDPLGETARASQEVLTRELDLIRARDASPTSGLGSISAEDKKRTATTPPAAVSLASPCSAKYYPVETPATAQQSSMHEPSAESDSDESSGVMWAPVAVRKVGPADEEEDDSSCSSSALDSAASLGLSRASISSPETDMPCNPSPESGHERDEGASKEMLDAELVVNLRRTHESSHADHHAMMASQAAQRRSLLRQRLHNRSRSFSGSPTNTIPISVVVPLGLNKIPSDMPKESMRDWIAERRSAALAVQEEHTREASAAALQKAEQGQERLARRRAEKAASSQI